MSAFHPVTRVPVPLPTKSEQVPGGEHRFLVHRLKELRAELADLAFFLERQGRLDAADLANSVGGRIVELAAEGTGGWTEQRADPAVYPG